MSKRIEELERKIRKYEEHLWSKPKSNACKSLLKETKAKLEERKLAEKEIEELNRVIDIKNMAINELKQEKKNEQED